MVGQECSFVGDREAEKFCLYSLAPALMGSCVFCYTNWDTQQLLRAPSNKDDFLYPCLCIAAFSMFMFFDFVVFFYFNVNCLCSFIV